MPQRVALDRITQLRLMQPGAADVLQLGIYTVAMSQELNPKLAIRHIGIQVQTLAGEGAAGLYARRGQAGREGG